MLRTVDGVSIFSESRDARFNNAVQELHEDALSKGICPNPTVALPGFVLSRMSLRERGGGASLDIRFSGGLAPYSIVHRSATSYSIVFAQTMISAAGVHVPRARGLLTKIALIRGNGIVSLEFSTSQPVIPRIVPAASRLTLYLSPAAPTPEGTANLAGSAAAPLSTITKVVRLRHASLDEIAALVSPSPLHGGRSFQTTSILSQAPLSGGYGGGSFGGTLPGGSLSLNMRNQLGSERISDNVAIDRGLNAVIVTGSPEQVAPIVDRFQRMSAIPVLLRAPMTAAKKTAM